jgi:hypothetical protein
MDKLSTDNLITIFDLLSLSELQKYVGVCKKWASILSRGSFWRNRAAKRSNSKTIMDNINLYNKFFDFLPGSLSDKYLWALFFAGKVEMASLKILNPTVVCYFAFIDCNLDLIYQLDKDYINTADIVKHILPIVAYSMQFKPWNKYAEFYPYIVKNGDPYVIGKYGLLKISRILLLPDEIRIKVADILKSRDKMDAKWIAIYNKLSRDGLRTVESLSNSEIADHVGYCISTLEDSKYFGTLSTECELEYIKTHYPIIEENKLLSWSDIFLYTDPAMQSLRLYYSLANILPRYNIERLYNENSDHTFRLVNIAILTKALRNCPLLIVPYDYKLCKNIMISSELQNLVSLLFP